MNKVILIPVTGTVAALIAILVFRQEREQPARPRPPAAVPPIESPAPPTRPPAPAPRATEWFFNLESDGSLTATDSGERYGSVAEVLDVIAPAGAPRPKVVVGPGEGVGETQLEQAVEALSERCDVRIFRRG